MAGTWLGVKSVTFFFGQNFRILARKSVFCYRTPDFVNGPFVALDDIFDLAPSDRFLNFLNQESYRVPKKSGPRKKGFWPFSLAGWFYMDRNNAV